MISMKETMIILTEIKYSRFFRYLLKIDGMEID